MRLLEGGEPVPGRVGMHPAVGRLLRAELDDLHVRFVSRAGVVAHPLPVAPVGRLRSLRTTRGVAEDQGVSTTTAATLVRGEELARRGQARAAIELMTAANRAAPDPGARCRVGPAALRRLARGRGAAAARGAGTPGGRARDIRRRHARGRGRRPRRRHRPSRHRGVWRAHRAGAALPRVVRAAPGRHRPQLGRDPALPADGRPRHRGFHPIDTDAHGLTMAARQWGSRAARPSSPTRPASSSSCSKPSTPRRAGP